MSIDKQLARGFVPNGAILWRWWCLHKYIKNCANARACVRAWPFFIWKWFNWCCGGGGDGGTSDVRQNIKLISLTISQRIYDLFKRDRTEPNRHGTRITMNTAIRLMQPDIKWYSSQSHYDQFSVVCARSAASLFVCFHNFSTAHIISLRRFTALTSQCFLSIWSICFPVIFLGSLAWWIQFHNVCKLAVVVFFSLSLLVDYEFNSQCYVLHWAHVYCGHRKITFQPLILGITSFIQFVKSEI